MAVTWQCTKKAFKDSWIKNLTNTCNMQISDSTIPGLYLRYYAGTNKISFYLGYRNATTKKHRNFLVGKYSDFNLSEIKERAIVQSVEQRTVNGPFSFAITLPKPLKKPLKHPKSR